MQRSGDELKLVFPQIGFDPAGLRELSFRNFFLQPMDGPDQIRNTRAGGALLHGASAVAVEPADAQVSGDSVEIDGDIQAVFRLRRRTGCRMCRRGTSARRMHGHSFQIQVYVRGPVDAQLGWVMDFAEIKAAFAPIEERIDHHCLNEVAGLENPTSENLARWIWRWLRPALPLLSKIVVQETCTSGCVYSGELSKSRSA